METCFATKQSLVKRRWGAPKSGGVGGLLRRVFATGSSSLSSWSKAGTIGGDLSVDLFKSTRLSGVSRVSASSGLRHGQGDVSRRRGLAACVLMRHADSGGFPCAKASKSTTGVFSARFEYGGEFSFGGYMMTG